MTAKRFMVDDAGELIDLNNHKFIDYGGECCNLLNELAEENEQLQNTIARLQLINDKLRDKDYTNYKKKIQELSKENKELKQSIRVIYDLIDGYIAIADKYRKPIKSLGLGDDLGYWNGVYQYMKKLKERIW